MIYLVGLCGLILGFAAGIQLIKIWLKDRPTQDLLQDKNLKTYYGSFVWLIAAICCAASIWLFKLYF